MRATTPRVDRAEKVGDGGVRGGVLELHEGEDIGVERADHDRGPLPLPVQLRHAVSAAAILRAPGPHGPTLALAVVSMRGEVVEQVHARRFDRTADRRRGRRARICNGERRRGGLSRADAPGVGAAGPGERPVQHAGQRVDEIAAAEEIDALGAHRKAAVGLWKIGELTAIGQRQWSVWCVVRVIQKHSPPQQIVEVRRQAGDARRRALRELTRPVALIQLDLAKPLELEMLRDRQRVDEGDAHPFAGLVEVVDDAHHGQVDRTGCHLGEMVAGVGDDHCPGGARRDLGHVGELRHRPGHPHPLALGYRRRTRAAENKEALRRHRIGVGIGVFFLQEEPRKLRAALVVADDDTFNRDRRARYRCRRAGALDVVDQSGLRRGNRHHQQLNARAQERTPQDHLISSSRGGARPDGVCPEIPYR